MRRLAHVALVGVVLASAVTGALRAQAQPGEEFAWASALPVFEGKQTDVGWTEYLLGSTLILLAPGRFEGYWPDYGYSWAGARHAQLCGSLASDRVRADASVGRVRVVAPKRQDPREFIGVELAGQVRGPIGAESVEVSVSPPSGQLTVEQLCGWLRSAQARKGLEKSVLALADEYPLPSPEKWGSTQFEEDGRYKLLWTGTVVGDADASLELPSSWGLDEGWSVNWQRYKPATVSEVVNGQYKSGWGWKFLGEGEEGRPYILSMAANGARAGQCGLSAMKSLGLDDPDFEAPQPDTPCFRDLDPGDLVFEMWSEVAGVAAMFQDDGFPSEPLYLVTEYAIPVQDWTPAIRLDE